MEIIVQGKGTDFFTPDQVIFNMNFFIKEQTYEGTLQNGVRSVQQFVDEILLKNNFKKEDMTTRSFVIREETKYNEVTRTYDFDGYSFSQMASLKFDYDKDLMATMMVEITKLENPPMLQIKFGLKEEEKSRKQVLVKAYQDAEEKAKAIAEASQKVLKICQKVDFKTIEPEYVSNTLMGSDIMYAEKVYDGATQTIVNTFTPEDIELSEILYCVWIAE